MISIRRWFANPATIWDLLRENPDKYIFPAVRHGCHLELPTEIAKGIDTTQPNLLDRRKGWNAAAPSEFALPNETWREVVARRQRCAELRRRLAAGEIRSINDFITLNLDIRQFAQDVIDTCEGPDLLSAFWQAVSSITVLDPTGGSGAFLFAALNILLPLYEACLDRMRAFLAEWGENGKKSHPNYHKKFTDILDSVAAHPNPRYFVLKSIILKNLYAVDIMAEAVEICKLRLFLKLVALVEPDASKPNHGIEPLPDIDFNIRCGNTLVGYATEAEVKKAICGDVQGNLDFNGDWPCIQTALADVQQTFDAFRAAQLSTGSPPAEHKKDLEKRLGALRQELDLCLASDYGIAIKNKEALAKWKDSHQPFHWFVEFYGILKVGGFDVIIGNPPYISSSELKNYHLLNYETIRCTDIYAYFLERSEAILFNKGRTGMIVPISLGFSSDFDSIRKLIFREYKFNMFSSFARIPAALFSANVRVRNTIHIASREGYEINMTTRLQRWFEDYRPYLFQTLQYADFSFKTWNFTVPKVNSQLLCKRLEQVIGSGEKIGDSFLKKPTKHILYFKGSAYNWLSFSSKQPPCFDVNNNLIEHGNLHELYFENETLKKLALAILNSKLLFIWWLIIGDDLNVPCKSFSGFPLNISKISDKFNNDLLKISDKIENELNKNITFKLNAGKKVGTFNLAKCRPVTNLADLIILDHLGIEDAFEEIENYYAAIVKTDFSDNSESD